MNDNNFELKNKDLPGNDNIDEVNYDTVSAVENVSRSEEANSEGVEKEVKADAPKEATVEVEGDNASVQRPLEATAHHFVNSSVWGTQAESGVGSNEPAKNVYSANYTPPYYIPNYTVIQTNPTYASTSGGRAGDADSGRKKSNGSKSFGIGAIIISVAASVAISLFLGSIAGAFMGGISGSVGNMSSSDGVINIITSDREINVVEIPGNTGYTDLTVAQVAALVGESVVEITTAEATTNPYYGQYVTSGAGSGVIIDYKSDTGNGYIVTNYHVVDGADKIIVRIKNGNSHKEYLAEYIAGDEGADIAVLMVTADKGHTLRPVVFVSDSDKLTVGEQVVAIGNPLGSLGGTVTDGIISALDREITVGDHNMTLLQTNAAINPGNSGGGLFNMAGELVGIVNAKQSSTGIEGLGFAIPANKVRSDINDIMTVGYITGRKTIGVGVQYGTYNYGSGFFGGGSVTGVIVVDAGSTGFQYGDCITKIGDASITSLYEYNAAVDALNIGDTVTVQFTRSGKAMSLNIKVKEDTSK